MALHAREEARCLDPLREAVPRPVLLLVIRPASETPADEEAFIHMRVTVGALGEDCLDAKRRRSLRRRRNEPTGPMPAWLLHA